MSKVRTDPILIAAGNRGRGVDDGKLRPEGGGAVVAAVSPAKML